MKRTALITGINGMDGSHLADLLLDKNYRVFGMERRNSSKNRTNTAHLEGKIEFITGDLADQNSLLRALKVSEPDEVYNLGAQSFVAESWNTPEYTCDITGLGVLRILEAIRMYGNPGLKFYQAGSSEMYGKMAEDPANENTEFRPRSPYGVAKTLGFHITRNYRESYGIFACCGILFNHESERRGIEFVTRKISDGVARIKLGLSDVITLGNIDARRDWGYAPDYVRAMWLMLQQNSPDDYVIATGKPHSVRDFLSAAFKEVDIEDYTPFVAQDLEYVRPTEIDVLRGDYSKAKKVLAWQPTIAFEELVSIMVHNDIERLS